MKEREPDFEDAKIRAWLERPKEHVPESPDTDPTIMAIEEETEEIFESRAYHLKPGPETFSLALGLVAERMGDCLPEIPPWALAYYALDTIEDASIKFLAKRHKEDGRITYILVGISHGSRWLLDRQELVDEADYREVYCLPRSDRS